MTGRWPGRFGSGPDPGAAEPPEAAGAPGGAERSRGVPGARRASPGLLFVLTLSAVFAGEAAVMLLLPLGPPRPLPAALLDGLFVSGLVVPVLYYLLVRPLARHVRELDRVRGELETSREAYRALIDSTEDSIYVVDTGGRYLFINRFHADRLDLPEEHYLGRAYRDFHTPEKAAEFAGIVEGVVRGGRSARYEHWSRRDGRCFLRTFTPVRDRAGRTVAVTVVSKDITELKQLEGRLQELSTTDELTGLQNRRGFGALAGHRLRVAARERAEVALLFADLDNLKTVNDTRGHQEGDRVIRDAARILAESCRESDVVARVGGDEFAVLATGASEEAIAGIVSRIREGVRRHNANDPSGLPLSLSLGVARSPAGVRCSIEDLLRGADQAMYEAKAGARVAPWGPPAGPPVDIPARTTDLGSSNVEGGQPWAGAPP